MSCYSLLVWFFRFPFRLAYWHTGVDSPCRTDTEVWDRTACAETTCLSVMRGEPEGLTFNSGSLDEIVTLKVSAYCGTFIQTSTAIPTYYRCLHTDIHTIQELVWLKVLFVACKLLCYVSHINVLYTFWYSEVIILEVNLLKLAKASSISLVLIHIDMQPSCIL